MTQYDVYLRNEEGKRGPLINGIVSISPVFRFNQPVKWTIVGTGLEECPLADGAEIVVFRNSKVHFCGYMEKKKTKYDAKTRIYDWEVSGQSDLGKLTRRMTFPDPSVASPDPAESYSATGVLSTVLLNTIDVNAGASAQSVRKLGQLAISEQQPVGDTESIESKYDALLKFVQDKLKDTDIQIRETWDMSTGEWDIEIFSPEDVSDKVIFSVDNGSISAWEQTVTAPKANWLLVTGCQKPIDENDPDSETETMSVIVYDSGSIDRWGRIEDIVSRSDISRIIEKDDDGNITYEEPWSEVARRLETAAYEELEKNTAQFGYKLTTTEINRNVYLDDYDIGSMVSVRIGSDEFTAKVEEIKITYAKGVETIVPSVGTMQKGELQSVFSELGTLKEQIKVLQKA